MRNARRLSMPAGAITGAGETMAAPAVLLSALSSAARAGARAALAPGVGTRVAGGSKREMVPSSSESDPTSASMAWCCARLRSSSSRCLPAALLIALSPQHRECAPPRAATPVGTASLGNAHNAATPSDWLPGLHAHRDWSRCRDMAGERAVQCARLTRRVMVILRSHHLSRALGVPEATVMLEASHTMPWDA